MGVPGVMDREMTCKDGRIDTKKQPRDLSESRLLGKIEKSSVRSSLGGRRASLADDAVHGFGRLGTDGEPFVSERKIDGVVRAFDQRIVGANLLNVTPVATLAAVNGNDFIVRAVFGALAVEADGYGHDVKRRLRLPETGGRGNCKIHAGMPSRILINFAVRQGGVRSIPQGMSSRGHFRTGNQSGEFVFKGLEQCRILDFLTVGGRDIKGVHGHSLFGADPGVGGVQPMLVERTEEVVQQPDPVQTLDFHAGAGRMEVISDRGADWNRNSVVGPRLEEVHFPAEIFFRVVAFSNQHGFKGLQKSLAGGCG
jgi:hypothetical protein